MSTFQKQVKTYFPSLIPQYLILDLQNICRKSSPESVTPSPAQKWEYFYNFFSQEIFFVNFDLAFQYLISKHKQSKSHN